MQCYVYWSVFILFHCFFSWWFQNFLHLLSFSALQNSADVECYVLIWSSLSLRTACMVSCSLKQSEQSVIVWVLNKGHLNDWAWTPVYLSGWAGDCSWLESNLQRRFMSFFRMPDDVLAHICAVHQLPINLLLQTAVCCLSQVLFIHISFFV